MNQTNSRSGKLGCAAAAVFALLTLGANPRARAEDKPIKQAEVPAPVMARVNAKYPGADLKAFALEVDEQKDGKPVYEVELKHAGTKVAINLSAAGKILAEEITIEESQLPAPVKAALQSSKYKDWKIKKAERLVTDEKTGEPSYEVVVKSDGKRFEIGLDRTGKITREQPKSKKSKD